MHTITIPDWHPTRLNQFIGCHWRTVHKLKKADAEMVATYAKLAGVPTAETRRKVTLTVSYGPRQRQADKDAYWKSLLDALVCAGMLVDDSPRWVETDGPHYERGAKETRIELVDLPNIR